jgi:hypothetical protein
MTSATLNSPEQIALLRRQLFELKDEVVLTIDDWQAIWPFIDNMWVERNASRAKDRQQFNCRIWRNDSDKKSGSGRRNRVRRDVEPCSMKMYVIQKDGGVIISRCPGRTNDVREHNHDLGYLDKVKTPTAIMRAAADVMSMGKTPSEAVKELKQLPIVQALERDGGLYIDSNRVRNAHKASQHPHTNGTTTAAQKRNFLAGIASLQAIHEAPTALMTEGVDSGPGLEVACQCGNVRFTTPYAKPIALYHCHCLECQKQSASAFGTSAIYPADSIFPLSEHLQEQLSLFTRATKTGGTMDCYFCKTCGSRMFHRGTGPDGTPKDTISVKGGVIEGLDWSGATHIWTSRAVVSIPDNVEKWRESPDPEPIPAPAVARLNDLAAMATATAASSAAVLEAQRHHPIDPAINPDLPPFPFS